MPRVTVRYFAGARAAAGLRSEDIELEEGASVADLLDVVAGRHGETLSKVLAGCSFLLDSVAVRDRYAPIANDTELDVLPPFAGG